MRGAVLDGDAELVETLLRCGDHGADILDRRRGWRHDSPGNETFGQLIEQHGNPEQGDRHPLLVGEISHFDVGVDHDVAIGAGPIGEPGDVRTAGVGVGR